MGPYTTRHLRSTLSLSLSRGPVPSPPDAYLRSRPCAHARKFEHLPLCASRECQIVRYDSLSSLSLARAKRREYLIGPLITTFRCIHAYSTRHAQSTYRSLASLPDFRVACARAPWRFKKLNEKGYYTLSHFPRSRYTVCVRVAFFRSVACARRGSRYWCDRVRRMGRLNRFELSMRIWPCFGRLERNGERCRSMRFVRWLEVIEILLNDY